MEFVIREKKPNETIWKIKYYDCDLHTSGNLSSFSFESAEVAEAYGKKYYAYENTGNTSYQGVVEVKEENNEHTFFACEDANRPGWIETFNTEEEMNNFIKEMNSTEGTCFLQINPDEIETCYEEPEEPEDEEFWAKEEQKWKDEEECRADLVWEEMEDSLLGRRRRQ